MLFKLPPSSIKLQRYLSDGQMAGVHDARWSHRRCMGWEAVPFRANPCKNTLKPYMSGGPLAGVRGAPAPHPPKAGQLDQAEPHV